MEFANRRVFVLGLGVENVPLARWLVAQGANVTVGDEKQKDELPQYNELQTLPIAFRFGPRYLDALDHFEIIFRTPGAKLTTKKKLAEAAKKDVEITSQTKLFFDRCPAQIIGVTGTKGKGTTSLLIYEMLKHAKLPVFLGGNIGTPPITFLHKLTAKDWVVLELSSFQVEDLTKSPHIAVVLGVTPDHLDVHPTFLSYLEAKKQMVRNQSNKDFAVLSADHQTTREFAVETKAEVYWFSHQNKVERGAFVTNDAVVLRMGENDQPVVTSSEIHLVGRHNLENISAASVAANLAGADLEAIRAGARSFMGEPHALEFIGEKHGVKYYNDSHATTPVPTIAAVRAFTEPTTIILGGSSKKADFRELGRVIAKESSVKHVILLGSVEAPKIRSAIESEMEKKQSAPDFYPVMSMTAAVQTAKKLAQPGETVLLSPAAASFDLFKNYKDRGEQFIKAVQYGA